MRRRRGVPTSLGLGLFVVLLGAVRPARADEATAAETFRVGTAAYAQGEYRAAALAFEAAFREQPHAAALYNAGRSWAAAGALPRAADAYAAALQATGLDATQEADARARLRKLETSLGMVLLTAPVGARVSLEHVDHAPAPALVHVTPGEHTAHAELPDGQVLQRSVRVSAGERVTVAYEGPAPPAPLPPSRATPPAAAPENDRTNPAWLVGWGAASGAVLASGAAVILGVNALEARDRFYASGFKSQTDHDLAATLRTWTNVSWAGAGVLGATGAALLLLTPRHPGSKAVISVSLGGAAVSGSF